MSRALLRAVVLTALYGGVVVWLTWPLGIHLGTHLPATSFGTTFDTLLFAWALSHESQALAAGIAATSAASIYHPSPYALFYCETGFGVLPLFAPSFLLTANPALALNLTLLASATLTAVAVHAVVERWTGSHLGGFVAAWTLLTTRWLLWDWGPVAPTYALVAYLPMIILAAATPDASLAGALRLLPLVALQGLTSIYMAAAVMVPLGLLAASRLARTSTRAAGGRLLLVLLAAAVSLLPFYAGYVRVFLDNPHLREQSVWRHIANLPVQLPWDLFQRHPLAMPRIVFPLVLAGGLALVWHNRTARTPAAAAWGYTLFWVVCGFVLSLTPVVRWYGTPIALPQAYLPFGTVIRMPQRIGVVALVGLAMLAGMAFVECTRRAATPGGRSRFAAMLRPGLALLLAALMYRECVRGYASPPVRRTPLPSSYLLTPAIGRDDPLVGLLSAGDGAVLELPIGEHGTPWPEWNALAMYRSIFHRRPILNGYCSYWPAGFMERVVLANRLPDRAALAALRAETGLSTVVVHLGLLRDAQQTPWRTLADAQDADFRLTGRVGDDLVFAVAP